MERINETNELNELKELGNDAIEKVNEVNPIEYTDAAEHKKQHNSIPFIGTINALCYCSRCVGNPKK